MNDRKLKKIGDRLARDPRVQRHHFIIVNTDGTYLENWSGYGSNNADRPTFSMLPMTDENTYGQRDDDYTIIDGDSVAGATNHDGDGNE